MPAMKVVVFLAALALSSAGPVQQFVPEELSDEYINNPRYILFENEEGLIEVEDLSNSTAQLFATENDVTFHFFTPENRHSGVEIKESQLHNIVRLTGFNVNRQTLVVIHGWKNHYESPVNDHIKNAVLASQNVNVIVVDWSPIASRNYVSAQGSVLKVGNYIGRFLLRLDNELNHRLSQLTIVGHSLGAHVAGNAGAATNGLIDTIVGLDPAGPLFSERNINNRLDPTDARYVQIIHTNDGLLGFGINMGHSDFYPNGGSSQPGCGIDLSGSCAHSRAYVYYSESLGSNGFVARLCEDYRSFSNNRCTSSLRSLLGGYPVQKTANGDFYLTTNNKSPFSRGNI